MQALAQRLYRLARLRCSRLNPSFSCLRHSEKEGNASSAPACSSLLFSFSCAELSSCSLSLRGSGSRSRLRFGAKKRAGLDSCEEALSEDCAADRRPAARRVRGADMTEFMCEVDAGLGVGGGRREDGRTAQTLGQRWMMQSPKAVGWISRAGGVCERFQGTRGPV